MIAISGLGAAITRTEGFVPFGGGEWGWLFVVFPVIPALFFAPLMWLIVLGVTCLLSLLNTLGPGHKRARFLRALTIWGTIVLGMPAVLWGFPWILAVLTGSY